jgi:hypothetical protein
MGFVTSLFRPLFREDDSPLDKEDPFDDATVGGSFSVLLSADELLLRFRVADPSDGVFVSSVTRLGVTGLYVPLLVYVDVEFNDTVDPLLSGSGLGV